MNTPQNDGGQAFPMYEKRDALRGMTLRDWFAGQALTSSQRAPFGLTKLEAMIIAKHAYAIADAMIARRNKKQNP